LTKGIEWNYNVEYPWAETGGKAAAGPGEASACGLPFRAAFLSACHILKKGFSI